MLVNSCIYHTCSAASDQYLNEGTGKSVLLREIVRTLRKKHVKTPDAVAITASTGTYEKLLARPSVAQRIQTGIAACNIGGVTIHSFAGIGLGIEPVEELVRRIKKNKKSTTRWLRTKVLIIDEGSFPINPCVPTALNSIFLVSMVDGDLFDKLAKIPCMLGKGPQSFGGIQVCSVPSVHMKH